MVNISELTALCDKLGCKITPECSLREFTTFRIGGPCRALVSINSAHSAAELLKYLKANEMRYGIIGRGSNIIVSDEGFDGVILLIGSDFAGITVEGDEIKCQAGALLASACVHAQQRGLTGMENLFGIPGTVGGALYMNAGAYGSEMKDVVVSAQYIDEDCNICNISAEDMALSYRHSAFSDRNCIIVVLSEDKRVGLLCDSVAGFTELNDGDIKPPTALNEEASARFLRGEVLLDDRHILLLDPIKLIKLGDEAVLETAAPEEGKEDTEQ